MQKYQDVVLKPDGTVIQGASVLVQSYPSGGAVTIYSDDGVTTQANPMTTDSLGRFAFYAADGDYQFVVSGSNIATYTVTDISLQSGVEDGTWTPFLGYNGTASSGATYIKQSGVYRKQGDWVTATCGMILSSNLGTGTGTGVGVGGLPYTANASYIWPVSGPYTGQTLVTPYPILATLGGGSKFVKLYKFVLDTAMPMSNTEIAAFFEVYFTVTYKV